MQSTPLHGRRYAVALVLSAVFWLLAWYVTTAQSMVAIWERSDTFAHGYLIVPISAWLVWERRRALESLALRPDYLALPALALAGFGWLLGHLASAGVVQQYCLVAMVPLLVWAILGREAVRAFAFPLSFLLFAVPFGEFLEPPLMEYTADFTVAALRASGIPVFREGLMFTLPSGRWSVVEACSGLRYLIASLTLGLLYAYLTYRSFARRALFVALSVIVPIVANWLRAYMIVMIGHLSSMKYAVGADHLVYGWVFFGLVMLVLFWIGSFWREDLEPQPSTPAPPGGSKPPSLRAVIAATLAAAATVAVWPVAAAQLTRAEPAPPPPVPPPAVGDWRPAAGRLSTWTPRYLPPAYFNQAYAKGTAQAGLYVGYYRNQWQGTALVSSQNGLVYSHEFDWRIGGESRASLAAGGEDIAPVETKLQGHSARLLVWHWFWVDGRYTANPYLAKLLQAKSALLGRGDDGAVVIVYTPVTAQPEAAARILQEFAGSLLPPLTRSLDDARRAQR